VSARRDRRFRTLTDIFIAHARSTEAQPKRIAALRMDAD
jgi:hypothetical protein